MRTKFPSVEYRDFDAFTSWCRKESSKSHIDYRLAGLPTVSKSTNGESNAEILWLRERFLSPGVRVAGYLRAEMGVGQLGRLTVLAIEVRRDTVLDLHL